MTEVRGVHRKVVASSNSPQTNFITAWAWIRSYLRRWFGREPLSDPRTGWRPSIRRTRCLSKRASLLFWRSGKNLREDRTTVGLPEPSDGASVPCPLNSRRLPGSSRRQAGTRQDWISYVSSHVSCVARRTGAPMGAQQKLMRHAHINDDGSVRQCFSNCEAKSQSANRAMIPQKKSSEEKWISRSWFN